MVFRNRYVVRLNSARPNACAPKQNKKSRGVMIFPSSSPERTHRSQTMYSFRNFKKHSQTSSLQLRNLMPLAHKSLLSSWIERGIYHFILIESTSRNQVLEQFWSRLFEIGQIWTAVTWNRMSNFYRLPRAFDYRLFLSTRIPFPSCLSQINQITFSRRTMADSVEDFTVRARVTCTHLQWDWADGFVPPLSAVGCWARGIGHWDYGSQ